MGSLTQWTWVWASSRSWWWTRKPGVLQFIGLQTVGHDWATELNWTDLLCALEAETLRTYSQVEHIYFMSEPNLFSIEIHRMSGLIQSWRYPISPASSNQHGGLRQWEFKRLSEIPAVRDSPSWVSWDPTHVAGSAENAKVCPLYWG